MNRSILTRPSPDQSLSSLESWPLRSRALSETVGAYALLTLLGLAQGWALLNLLGDSAIAEWDTAFATWVSERRTATVNVWSDAASAFSDTITIVIGILVLVPVLVWWWRRWREALTLGLALLLESTVFLTVSVLIGRDRPPVEQLDASPPTASFPSGHTGAAFAFYWALALIIFWNTDNRWIRTIATILAISIPLLVALSRLYRGMHYPTDIIVGAFFGITCLVTAAWIATRAVDRRAMKEPE
jgi:membrane-associated phospholipid phosphatase